MNPFFEKIKSFLLPFLKEHEAQVETVVNARIQALGDDLKAYIDSKISEILATK